MCGIAGCLSSKNVELESLAEAMCDRISRRGPDDAAYWSDCEVGLALGHRRLSIIDLSELGRQPMHSASGRYVTVFNGEIYNYSELRKELEQLSHSFKGSSDTEVLLAAFEEWGVEGTLKRSLGMFAIALWDKRDRILYLMRDRFGEKPLYYGWYDSGFIFASELSAFRALPSFKPKINRDAITLLLKHSYIEAPHSIYSGVYKLVQGTFLALPYTTLKNLPSTFSALRDANTTLSPRSYWRLEDVIKNGANNRFRGSELEACNELERLLKQSVKMQMVSDVAIGAFLSGGIDSSMIVALMQSQSSSAVKTFSIGFHEQAYNEAQYAKKVAKHIGTDHTELYVSANDLLDVVPIIPQLYSEPFSDSSQVPTYLVSKLARQKVTVSLSGDAGDELFGGYTRYQNTERLWVYLNMLPLSLKPLLSSLLKLGSQSSYDQLNKYLPVKYRQQNLGFKAHKVASLLSEQSLGSLYRELVSHWQNLDTVVLEASQPATILNSPSLWPDNISNLELMMYLDAASYLPDDLLVKVDRAAMGVSLETRVPFLDPRLVEFIYSLPTELRISAERNKILLKQLLKRYVPEQLFERPKMGFGIPLADWLRGPLRDWAEELLSIKRLDQEGYFNSAKIREKWEQHLSCKYNWQYLIWDVLMFQGWLNEQS